MEHRTVAGFPRSLSILGIEVGPMVLRLGNSPSPRLTLELLRRARQAGVVFFDTEAGGSSPAAERWIGTAFPKEDEGVVVATSAPANLGSLDAPSRQRAIEEVRHRLGGRPVDLLMVESAAIRDTNTLRALAEVASDSPGGGWGLRLPGRPDAVDLARRALDAGAGAIKVSYNLLDRAPAETILELCRAAGAAGIITNVHAGGLLDGGLLRASPVDHRSPPVAFREMEAQYAPVLALRYLTEGRRRTLAQAAIQFVAGNPAVSSILLAPDGAPILDEFLASAAAPEFTAEERRRLLAAPPAPALAPGSTLSSG